MSPLCDRLNIITAIALAIAGANGMNRMHAMSITLFSSSGAGRTTAPGCSWETDDDMLRIFNPDGRDSRVQGDASSITTRQSRARMRMAARRRELQAGIVAGQTSAHRTITPVRRNQPPEAVPDDRPESVHLTAIDPRVIEISAQVASANSRLVVPELERPHYAALPLRAWYDCPVYGPRLLREAEIAARRNRTSTAEKDLSVLRAWETHTRPDDWTGDAWPGISIGSITTDYLRDWISRSLQAGLSAGYLSGLCNHLSWMLRVAVEREILPRAPKKPAIGQVAARVGGDVLLASDDDLTVIYEVNGDILGTLDMICQGLSSQAELQTAFILACSCGLRPSDLFSLRWHNFAMVDGVPAFRSVPIKTQRYAKILRIPLADCVWQRLQAMRSTANAEASDLVFPSLVNGDCKTPGKSQAARMRNKAMRLAAEAAGFVFPKRRQKPWQIARATCNERLERHSPGIGEFILGHSAGSSVNKKHYRQIWSKAVEAVTTLPQPDSFLYSGDRAS